MNVISLDQSPGVSGIAIVTSSGSVRYHSIIDATKQDFISSIERLAQFNLINTIVFEGIRVRNEAEQAYADECQKFLDAAVSYFSSNNYNIAIVPIKDWLGTDDDTQIKILKDKRVAALSAELRTKLNKDEACAILIGRYYIAQQATMTVSEEPTE